MDGGELALCVRLGKRDLHVAHLRWAVLHGEQVHQPLIRTWPGVNHTIFQTCIQPAGTSDSVEYVPGSVQYYGGSQDYTRVHSYSLHTGILPLTLHTQVSQY